VSYTVSKKEETIRKVIKNNTLLEQSSRRVYEYNGNIMKIPKPLSLNVRVKPYNQYEYSERYMIFQNITELRVYQNCPPNLKYLLCPLVDYFYVQDIPILIFKRLEIVTPEVLEKIRSRTKNLGKYIEAYFKLNRFSDKYYRDIYSDILDLCDIFDLEPKDMIINWRNWGLDRDKFKIIDFGCLKKEKKQGIMFEYERMVKNDKEKV